MSPPRSAVEGAGSSPPPPWGCVLLDTIANGGEPPDRGGDMIGEVSAVSGDLSLKTSDFPRSLPWPCHETLENGRMKMGPDLSERALFLRPRLTRA